MDVNRENQEQENSAFAVSDAPPPEHLSSSGFVSSDRVELLVDSRWRGRRREARNIFIESFRKGEGRGSGQLGEGGWGQITEGLTVEWGSSHASAGSGSHCRPLSRERFVIEAVLWEDPSPVEHS